MILDKEHHKTAVYPSPFFPRTDPLNETREWSRWHDYLSATQYVCSTLEYFACRNTTGVFDLTAMSKLRITGPDAEAFLNRGRSDSCRSGSRDTRVGVEVENGNSCCADG